MVLVPEPVALDGCELKLVDPERVRAVQESMPDPDVIDELAEVFGLLSDPNRLRLLASLLEGGELCVCDLAAATGMAESTTSHALRLLRAHHVVKARRAGRMMHYSLRDGHVRMLLDIALEHVGHGERPGPVAVP
jgi:DNA-binding transcriptional ArsR family regulator